MPTLISHFNVNDPDDTLYTRRIPSAMPVEGTLNLGLVAALAKDDPIWSERGKAIQSYALLEASLCRLMEHTANIEKHVVGVIFYKNTSSSARNSILESLIRKKCGDKYNIFWNSYLKSLRQVDTKRNEIVHWLSVCYTRQLINGSIDIGIALVPPDYNNSYAVGVKNTINDIQEFSQKCGVYAQICDMFIIFDSSKMLDAHAIAWTEIFQQPFAYPLPADHLLCKTLSE